MDQVKIGSFLRELRKEKELTQEQLAEKFGVSSRTVSRWENGNNMPDISILADYYDVDIRELIDGERKSETMNTEMKDTLVKVAEYTEEEKKKITNSLLFDIIIAAIGFFALFVITALNNMPSFSNMINDGIAQGIALTNFAVMSVSILSVLRLKGKINKIRMKKIVVIGSLTAAALLVVSVLIVMILIGAIF